MIWRKLAPIADPPANAPTALRTEAQDLQKLSKELYETHRPGADALQELDAQFLKDDTTDRTSFLDALVLALDMENNFWDRHFPLREASFQHRESQRRAAAERLRAIETDVG